MSDILVNINIIDKPKNITVASFSEVLKKIYIFIQSRKGTRCWQMWQSLDAGWKPFFFGPFPSRQICPVAHSPATTSTSSLTVPPLTLGICFFTKTPPVDFSELEGKAKARRWWKSGCRRRSNESPWARRGTSAPDFITVRSNSCLDIYLGKHKCQCQSGAAGKVRRSPVTRFNTVTWCTAPLQTLPQCGGLVPLGEEKVASHTHTPTHSCSQCLGRFLYIRMGIVGSGCRT